MTLTLGPEQATEPERIEALIREARRLQRRRWWRGAAVVTLALVVAAVVVTSLQGGGPARPRPTPHRPGPLPAQRRVNGPSLGLATSYQLTGPIGVAVDRGGDIYFTDGYRVLEVDRATQQLVVVAGTGAVGFSGDGGPGPQATLSSPSGVAVAPNGDVYFEDGTRVRRVSASDRGHLDRGRERPQRLRRKWRPSRQSLTGLRYGRKRRRGPQRFHRLGPKR